jgi:hypothetical protein
MMGYTLARGNTDWAISVFQIALIYLKIGHKISPEHVLFGRLSPKICTNFHFIIASWHVSQWVLSLLVSPWMVEGRGQTTTCI